ncbi:hypothetical protein SPF06_20330 [Sinomonas sp. JGH33]|uniref:Aldose epimerase n=1 Tax=Sinomonas terricola TaxID=3110330 RepID=A0ABU5TC14_9MICC|nr:hypothetical protein [Sinomonas sp. JGH33]MEA5457077.1 hypothetical protein [Sinomonas sp. JGH33]
MALGHMIKESQPRSGILGTPSAAATRRASATGRQYRISRGGSTAVVTELAATLRSFEVDGVRLSETFADDEVPPYAAGITLAPWANRIEDGRWTLDGTVQQLDITEPSLNNAIHGLLRHTGYELLDTAEDRVVLEAAVFPQQGYPFLVRHRVEYTIDDDGGLRVRQSLTNDSSRPAPFVLGAHPYLRPGDVETGELTLTLAETAAGPRAGGRYGMGNRSDALTRRRGISARAPPGAQPAHVEPSPLAFRRPD